MEPLYLLTKKVFRILRISGVLRRWEAVRRHHWSSSWRHLANLVSEIVFLAPFEVESLRDDRVR